MPLHWRPIVLGVLVGLIVLSGCGRAAAPTGQPAEVDITTAATPTISVTPVDGARLTGPGAAQAPEPTRVRVPAIGVDSTMIPLGIRDDGTIEVPTDFDQTGWWVDGPEPGERGPVVILGHVDSRQGPAVFFDLDRLEPGDAIHIDRQDGSTVSYTVQRIEQHAKDAFPTQAVYGPTEHPVLRLVTCGGDFDRDQRSYEDNIIVFATLAP